MLYTPGGLYGLIQSLKDWESDESLAYNSQRLKDWESDKSLAYTSQTGNRNLENCH